MNQLEKIKSMKIDEMVDFIETALIGELSTEICNMNFCNTDENDDCDGNCRRAIKMYLESDVND